MKTKNLIWYFAVVVFFITTGCEKEALNPQTFDDYDLRTGIENRALSHTKKYDAEVATAWYTLLADLSRYTFYFNPQSARIFAYSGLTLYESVLPGMPSHQSMFYQLSGQKITFHGKPKDYYWPASANAALAEIARKLIIDYPQTPNLAAINELEQEIYKNFQGKVNPEHLENSVEFGKYVAEQIYQWSKSDGTITTCPPYIPLGNPENWVPTPPMFFPAAGACQGTLSTFIPEIAEKMMPPSPPQYSIDPASEFYHMNLEVQQITQNLTSEQLIIIQAWRDIPNVNHNRPSQLFMITSNLIEKENINLEDASVLLAKQGFAIFDAIVSVFAAKFEHALLRPVTYIHNVIGDASWQSVYPAPQHPSYPATSTGVTAAVVEILESYFGSNYAFEDSSQEELYGVFRYDSFSDMLEPAGISRTHSGINYELSVQVGEEMGRSVGEIVNNMDFQK